MPGYILRRDLEQIGHHAVKQSYGFPLQSNIDLCFVGLWLINDKLEIISLIIYITDNSEVNYTNCRVLTKVMNKSIISIKDCSN